MLFDLILGQTKEYNPEEYNVIFPLPLGWNRSGIALLEKDALRRGCSQYPLHNTIVRVVR